MRGTGKYARGRKYVWACHEHPGIPPPSKQWLILFGSLNRLLGGGFKDLFFPLPGKMIQFDEYIFQKGGSTTN